MSDDTSPPHVLGAPGAQPEIKFRTDIEFAYGVPREIVPGIVRIVADNPSPFTYKGTNTYLIGTASLALVDPGPQSAAHFDAVMRAIAGRPVSHILLTHTHHDHLDGLARLAAATRATIAGYGRRGSRPAGSEISPSGSERSQSDFAPDIVMRDGNAIAGDGWTLTAVHTPGHASDHLCFAVEGTGVLLSGDHVMAWNTSVVAPPDGSMADYLASLEKLLRRTGDALYLPGHGGRLAEPLRMVKAFLVHRRWREQAILEAVRNGNDTIDRVVGVVYRGLDQRLLNAAALSVQAHVEHLMVRGLLRADGPLQRDRRLFPA